MVISSLLFLVSLILLSFAISTYCDIKESFAPLISVCLMMGIGLLAGMLNILFIGVCALYAVTIIGGIFLVYKNREKFSKFILSLPIVCLIFSCLFIGILFLIKEPYFVSWDEFSHWGPFLKSIKTTGKLHVYTDLYSVHPTYVQGMSVLYYISSFFDGVYRESSVCYAYSTLLHICAITVVPNIPALKNRMISIANMLLIPLFWYFFPYASYAAPYTCSYLDAVLGALFGGIMMYILRNSNKKLWNPKKLWSLSILLFVLLQIKDISIVFYLICLATCTINLFYLMKTGADIGTKKKQSLILNHAVYTVVIPLSGKILWNIILKVTGKNVDQFSEATIGKAFGLLGSYISGEDTYFGQVADAFWNGIKSVNISWSRTAIPAVVFALLILSGVIIYNYYKSEKNKIISLHVGLLVGYFLLYMVVLFVTYLCGMSVDEAMSNASMDRYVATFVSGWTMILFGLLVALMYRYKAKAAAGLVLAVGVYIYATIPMNDVVYWNVTKEQAGLSWYEEEAEACAAVMEEDSKIWLIKSGNEDWMSKFIFFYKFMPQTVSFDVPMDDTSYTVTDLVNIAEAYEIDYFVILDSNEVFKEKYKNSISVESDAGDGRCMVIELTEAGKLNQIY